MRMAFLIGVGLAATAIADQWQVVTLNRITLEGASKDGGAFEVRVESKGPRQAAGEYFGATGDPQSVVSEIIVKTRGARIEFPKDAVADLANPLLQTTSITSQGSSNLKLRFTGGEGAQNYEVEYFIEGNKLMKRNVSYFERGGVQKNRVIKTMSFGGAAEATQPSASAKSTTDQ